MVHTREIKGAIKKAKIFSPGKDEISYAMLKWHNDNALRIILALYNEIWSQSTLPKTWKLAVIVPIKKPGKDPTVASNYRPIALTLQLCKIMERMITERISFLLGIKRPNDKTSTWF